MARTISQIQSQIMAQIAADPVLGTKLTSPSQVAIYQVYAYIVATALSIEEQLRDIFQTEIETDIANAPPGTPQWIVKQVLAFQYNATYPQVVQLLNFVPVYPVINTSYNVVAQCAVITDTNKNVLVKIAPADPTTVFDGAPGANGPTMIALAAYLDLINFAGVQFSLVNEPPDLFKCAANIYYDGQYSATMAASVTTAITNYLATLPFNGLITLYGGSSDPGLISAIMNVPGVEDVVFTDVELTNQANGNVTIMVNNQEVFYRNTGTFSGRAIPDTGSGRTLANTLSFYVNS